MLDTKDLREVEKKIIPHILKAGEMVSRSWHHITSIHFKDKRDVVTNVDTEVEDYLVSKLSGIVPKAGFLVEEGTSHLKNNYNWAIDPIDGTKYYANQLPFFVTQIALLENNIPILSCVYNPISKQLFTASRGNGTKYNGIRMIAKTQSSPDSSLLEVDFGGPDDEIIPKNKIFDMLSRTFFRVRIFGGTVISYMVLGAIDGYLLLNKKNKVVDLAPNIVILSEAGLQTGFIEVKGYKQVFCAANSALYEKLQDMLNNL